MRRNSAAYSNMRGEPPSEKLRRKSLKMLDLIAIEKNVTATQSRRNSEVS